MKTNKHNLQYSMIFLCLMVASHPAWASKNPMAAATLVQEKVPSKASFRGLHVLNEQVIWATGTENTVLLTENGGKSWRVLEVALADGKLDFRDVWVKDRQTVWLMAAGRGKASSIYVTKDGGQTWQPEHRNLVSSAFYDGFTFNGSAGTVYSDPVDGAFLLLRRKSGQWQPIKSDPMPPALAGEGSFAASGTGIVALEKQLWFGTGGASVARVFHSQDAGQSWQVAETPLRAGHAAAGVFSLAFRKAGIGVAVGGKYDAPGERLATAAYTTDRGKTWRLAEKLPRGYRSCVVYVPGMKTVLLAVGTNGADYSLDDGHSWFGFSDLKLNAVKFGADIKQGWAVGPEGMVAQFRLDPSKRIK